MKSQIMKNHPHEKIIKTKNMMKGLSMNPSIMKKSKGQ